MSDAYSEDTVELVARALFDAEYRSCEEPTWEGLTKYDRDSYRKVVRIQLDTLAAAGLLLPEGARTPAAIGFTCCEHCGAMGHARNCPAVAKIETVHNVPPLDALVAARQWAHEHGHALPDDRMLAIIWRAGVAAGRAQATADIRAHVERWKDSPNVSHHSLETLLTAAKLAEESP
jgi:hypothetical protein